MTRGEFLSLINSNNARFGPAADDRAITLASNGLQHIQAAMLPAFMMDLYKSADGIILGSAYIFGTIENNVSNKFPVPSIVQINAEISGIAHMRGKTVFGRNDLFWFAFDVYGTCYMLDNLGLRPLRKYDDPHRAMLDCLAVGKL